MMIDKKEAILEAFKLFADEHSRMPSWSEVESTIGIARSTVRHYFENLKEIELALLEVGVSSLIRRLPKILVFDIETAPMEVYCWQLWEQIIGLDQVIQHTTVLSWSAKWLGAPADQVMYRDNRNSPNVRDDKALLEVIWSLLDEADAVLTQNGIKFDQKKLNYRFAYHKMKPPSSYKHIDTYRIAKSKFGFDSNKLAHMTDLLCTKYKKLDHGKFAGFKLWKECLSGNIEAWKEMEKYNSYDVLSLEELYLDHFAAWDNTISYDSYCADLTPRCNCGNDEFIQKGYHVTKKSKFRRFICTKCGKETKDSENLFSKEKRQGLRI